MKRLSRVLELTSLLAGAALFLYVVRRAGPAVLMEYLGTIGWGFAGLLLVSAARHGFRTLAWGASLGAPARLGELYLVRLAGESVRGLTVLGPILGEPAKVWLLRHRVPGMEGARSLVLENLGYALTGGAAILGGVVVLLSRYPLDEGFRAPVWVLFSLTAAGMGSVLWLVRLVPTATGREGKWGALLRQAVLVREAGAGRLWKIAAWDALAHLSGTVEVYLILRWGGLADSWSLAFVLDALSKVINFTFFFVPLQMGVYEGGHGLFLHLIGQGTAAGVAVAVARKLRALFWTALGLAIYCLRVLFPGSPICSATEGGQT